MNSRSPWSSIAARLAAAAFGLATIAAFVIGAVGPDSWRHAIGSGGPACPFLFTTGIECPFCGLTRATLAMGHGDWREALALHPLAPVVVVFVLAVLAIVTLGRASWLMEKRRIAVILGVIAAIWVLRFVL